MNAPKVGEASPWGHIRRVDDVAPGLCAVNVNDMARLWASPERLATLPPLIKQAHRGICLKPGRALCWFDTGEISLAVVGWPDAFPVDQVFMAVYALQSGTWSKVIPDKWDGPRWPEATELAERFRVENPDMWVLVTCQREAGVVWRATWRSVKSQMQAWTTELSYPTEPFRENVLTDWTVPCNEDEDGEDGEEPEQEE